MANLKHRLQVNVGNNQEYDNSFIEYNMLLIV